MGMQTRNLHVHSMDLTLTPPLRLRFGVLNGVGCGGTLLHASPIDLSRSYNWARLCSSSAVSFPRLHAHARLDRLRRLLDALVDQTLG